MRRLVVGLLACFITLGAAGAGGGATAGLVGETDGLIAFSGSRSGDAFTVYTVRADGSSRRLVSAAAWTADYVRPVWSPDGRWVGFTDDSGIAIARADGSARRPVGQGIRGNISEGSAWSSDGRVILVPEDGVLWLVDVATGTATRLPGRAWHPAWSPSDKQIAFLADDAVWVMRPDGSGRRRLARVFDGALDRGSAPTWSPRGDTIAVEYRGDVYVVDVANGRATNLTRTRKQQEADPVWSPDGRWIAFVKGPPGRPAGAKASLMVIRSDGTGERTLADPTPGQRTPTWAPDSSRIAVIGRGGIYVARIAGGRPTRIMRAECGEELYGLVWARRGGRLAFSSTGASDNQIYLSRSDGTRIRRLATSCAWETDPAWSPDGRRIAYARGDELYVMQASGVEKRRVVKGGAPSWSPDGRLIAFSRRGQIYVIGADGEGERQLTGGPGRKLDPAWSPRGDRIAFTGVIDGSYEVFVIKVDGSDVTRLTSAGGWDPAWSPSGTRLAFARGSDIWVMRADGGAPARVASLDVYTSAFSPSWSPDGAHIVFAEITRDEGGGLAVVSSSGGEVRYLPYDPRFGAHSADGFSGDFEFDVDDSFANSPDWQPLPTR